MPETPTTPTPTLAETPAPKSKRNVLDRRQARLVEDALHYLSQQPGFWTMERRQILEQVIERVTPDVPTVTMANLVGAAEALDIDLPSRVDPAPAPTAREDRELLLEIAEIIDDLTQNSIAVRSETRERWAAYRARTRGLFAADAKS